MKVSVVGTGYVGLVSGTCLAEIGHDVTCVDIDKSKVDLINSGKAPIFEKDLDELLQKNIGQNLRATTDLRSAIDNSEMSLIAVGTPFTGDEIDLTYIKDVSRQVGEILRDKSAFHVVVVKSTVVPGTTDEVVLPVLEESSGKKAGVGFGVGMNPEFLREGEAVSDFMHPDRIVMGANDRKSHEALRRLYAGFAGVDKLETNNKTAEMIKYTSNSLLATMISFSNEIANLCSALGDIDVTEVMKGVHLDKRLCPITSDGSRVKPLFTTYIEAGCGFGGSCFPKDVKALIAHGKKAGRSMQLLESVITVNEKQPQQLLDLIREKLGLLSGGRLAVLGIAFKPGTDDIRESPAIPVINSLLAQGVFIQAYDPVASSEAKKLFGDENIVYCNSLNEAIDGVQGVVIMTRWDEFRKLPEILRGKEPQPVVFDGRRMLDKASVQQYAGIGL